MQAELLMSSHIEFGSAHSEMLDMSWLAQANACLGPTVAKGKQGHGEAIKLFFMVQTINLPRRSDQYPRTGRHI
jgi:hypothetical protein